MIKKTFFGLIVVLVLFQNASAQDTLAVKRSFYRKNLLIPSVGVGLGLYSRFNNVPLNKYAVYKYKQSILPNFHAEVDDYFQFAPIAITYGLHFTNLKRQNTFFDKSLVLGASHVFMASMVYPMKYLIGDQRPNNGNFDAFPSGHTTEAFMTAQFLWKEYGKNYPLIGVVGYSFATATGVFRILKDKHWSADVLAGAGIGILSTNLAYFCLQEYRRRHPKQPFRRK